MIKNIRLLLILSTVFLCSSCAETRWMSFNSSWNPPQGIEWAAAQCKSKGDVIISYNGIDEGFRRGEAFHNCMESYGYRLYRVSKDEKLIVVKMNNLSIKWNNKTPSLNPPQGLEWAKAKCYAKNPSKIAGYIASCMKIYGYEMSLDSLSSSNTSIPNSAEPQSQEQPAKADH